eukprot:768522-Hanusia_phi.AAC.1
MISALDLPLPSAPSVDLVGGDGYRAHAVEVVSKDLNDFGWTQLPALLVVPRDLDRIASARVPPGRS